MTISNRTKGTLGESLASAYLRQNGFLVLVKNYSSKANFQGGEIDIIAKKGEMIHFIEVKMRRDDCFGQGAEAVTKAKQKTIRRLATRYLVEQEIYYDALCCFDVIEITGFPPNHRIEFLENCF